LIIFVRYKISVSATEGLVQQGFAKSGAEVLLLNISARFNSSNSIDFCAKKLRLRQAPKTLCATSSRKL
ncbi:hypothetical protein, partial [Flavobacterium macacae]|uniref:hypothetical protein n=1 Tax=Flavobacterium macacae TaxID=2488993 RepID=UPI001F2EEB62